MTLTFQKLARSANFQYQARNTGYLKLDNWDDFGHKTLFSLTVFDQQGHGWPIGNIKIGFVGQNEGSTQEEIPEQFEELSKFKIDFG